MQIQITYTIDYADREHENEWPHLTKFFPSAKDAMALSEITCQTVKRTIRVGYLYVDGQECKNAGSL